MTQFKPTSPLPLLILLAALPFAAHAASVNDTAVWLNFTNVSGNTVFDSSPKGNNGTLGASASRVAGGGPTTPGGLTLDAAEFTGANDAGNSIIIADSASMDFNHDRMSIVFWTKLDALPDRLSFLKTDNLSSADGMDLQKHRNSLSPSDIFTSPKGQNFFYNTTNKNTLVVGQWVHIAIAWDWVGTNYIRYSINGSTNTHQIWFNNAPNPSPQGMSSGNWYLGWDPVVNTRPLDGRIADFAIFTNTLSPAQIFEIYSNGVGSVGNAVEPPADTNAPDPVVSLTATGGVQRVDLDWQNPTNADFAGVLILRNTGAAPTATPTQWVTYTSGQLLGDATVVYSGPASNAAPGAASTWADTNAVLAITNYYAVFAFDPDRNYATAPSAGAHPLELDLPPDPVSALGAFPDTSTIDLYWINPTNADFTGVLIVRRPATTPSASPIHGQVYAVNDPLGDGTVVYVGGGGDATPGAASNWLDADLPDAGVFYYLVFTFDAAIQYSTGESTGTGFNHAADSDGDGMSNAEEYEAGTDPLNSASFLLFVSHDAVGTVTPEIFTDEFLNVYTVDVLHVEGVVLGWPSESNRFYHLLSTTNLMHTPFAPLVSDIPATPPLNVYTTVPGPVSPGFYLLQVTSNAP